MDRVHGLKELRISLMGTNQCICNGTEEKNTDERKQKVLDTEIHHEASFHITLPKIPLFL